MLFVCGTFKTVWTVVVVSLLAVLAPEVMFATVPMPFSVPCCFWPLNFTRCLTAPLMLGFRHGHHVLTKLNQLSRLLQKHN